MSEEHVEIVRRFLDAYVAADYERAASLLHAEAQWHNTPSFPGPQTVDGPEAIRHFWRDMFEAFAGPSRSGSGMEAERITDHDDVVVAEVHGWGAGKSSAARFDRRWAHAFRHKDGKIVRIDTYGSYERALEVLGLEHHHPAS
jgi:ketosteroid isomerase-like protein